MPRNTEKNAGKRVRKAPVKKPVQKKTASKRRRKQGISDAIQAALLTGILISAAVIISCVIIIVKSSQKARLTEIETQATENLVQASPAPSQAEQLPPVAQPLPVKTDSISEQMKHDVEQQPETPGLLQQQAQQKPKQQKQAPVQEQPPRSPQFPHSQPAQTTPPKQTTQPVRTPNSTNPKKASEASPPVQPRPVHKGSLVFIIDDAGNNLRELEPFLRFPGPLTIAVLPGLPHSAEAARRIRAAGKEVFLHQPMEALGGQPPGPGAIYSGMSDEEIRFLLRKNTDEIGPIAGMNNHQGSKITMDAHIMEIVLEFCRDNGLCFLDSRTTADTQAPFAARQLGIKIGQRNFFIDNEQDRNSMSKYINDGFNFAQRNGSAVLIGHTWSAELGPLLLELYPRFAEQGYTLNIASKHIRSL